MNFVMCPAQKNFCFQYLGSKLTLLQMYPGNNSPSTDLSTGFLVLTSYHFSFFQVTQVLLANNITHKIVMRLTQSLVHIFYHDVILCEILTSLGLSTHLLSILRSNFKSNLQLNDNCVWWIILTWSKKNVLLHKSYESGHLWWVRHMCRFETLCY